MIPVLAQSRAVKQQQDVIDRAAKLLHPKLKKLLNPNIVDCWVRLTLHLQNGELQYIHDADSQPSYAHDLVEQDNGEQITKTLAAALKTIKARIEGRIGAGWHGKIIVLLSLSCGEATITSEVDGVHRLG